MKKLNHKATWVTKCFIDSGCNEEVYAHTNGYGNFVLFDDLGYPWPIHECYTKRKRSSVSLNRSRYKIDYGDVESSKCAQWFPVRKIPITMLLARLPVLSVEPLHIESSAISTMSVPMKSGRL
ncbi:MAG: hypothetical protein OXU62_00480 [Gammaproteobacteria bacterium]|nr:hypothetical protein [Gammaproteobacteria bacterium]